MKTADIVAAARRQGWKVSTTKRGHIKLVPTDPSKPIVVASGTPSDHRAVRNLLALARRSGLVYPLSA
jgi:hypothetical protein